jgi:N-acetylmuramic acid 6-phosphate etherase
MVDLRPGSAKLRDRSLRIVAEAGGVLRARAEALLAEAGGEVKTALVMARLGVGPEDARRGLAAAGGSVRRALEG